MEEMEGEMGKMEEEMKSEMEGEMEMEEEMEGEKKYDLWRFAPHKKEK
jgi:hypothetical protein